MTRRLATLNRMGGPSQIIYHEALENKIIVIVIVIVIDSYGSVQISRIHQLLPYFPSFVICVFAIKQFKPQKETSFVLVV